MIPILFASTETDFTHNGIGRLVDCISCSVTEERNGLYELELKYPITGRWFDELMQGGIIGVIHDDNHDIQPFDIYRTSAVIDGIVTVNAHHVSYRLNNIILQPFTAASASAAIAAIPVKSVNTNPFTFNTDRSVTADIEIDKPQSVRQILWGQEGSLLDVYGPADFKFDKFTVSMLSDRGSDTGVTIRYGKNLTKIEWDRDKSGTCSALAPYWTNGMETVYPSEIIVQPTTAITPVVPSVLDMSDKFETKPTEAQLRAAAKAYLDANAPWNPSDTIKIDFAALWQTTEYESLAAIQRVGLCDTVSIYWTDMGIVSEKAKVVKVVFDVLAERFTSMEIGTVSTSYVAITDGTQQAASAKATSAIYNIIQAQGSGSSAVSLTAGTMTQIPLSAEMYNSGFFSVENGGITVPVTGYYRVSASVYLLTQANTLNYGVFVREGSDFATATEIAGSNMIAYNTANQYPSAMIVPKIVHLTAGNSVYLACRVGGAAGSYYPTNGATFLQLELISASGSVPGVRIEQDSGTGSLYIS